ncbi:hypothetical protein CC99x_008010 [Candidatus Berkiella cookevillensis]|uniref:Uncharacterized protein n=1 Tax=Candidatus Berkiella cookevillensis TaxID=437022 RepID=A0A0Q9YNT3_9GAMM|nr:hypothetical protein [Candidatus Berkiella cookevillensis]MCS5708848.1 hypothetical protein [Candidatus Berkiella cookevillensis]
MKELNLNETKEVTGASLESVNTFIQVLELAKALNSKDYMAIINENFPDFIEYFIEHKDSIAQKLHIQL